MRRPFLLSALLYGLLLAGLGTLDGRLLALAVPLGVYLGAALLLAPGAPRLRIRRRFGANRVVAGTPVAVQVEVHNEGPRQVKVLIEDAVPPRLEVVDGKPRLLALLPPGETVKLEYVVRGGRGEYAFQDVRITVSDPLDLLPYQVSLPSAGRLLVLPRTIRLRRVVINPARTRGRAGSIPARQGGPGVTFFGVREYRPGDPLRWINWRASARYPRGLIANEFEQERIADVGLILDARRRTNVRHGDDTLFEHAVQATASLAEALLRDGNRVGLLVYGKSLEWTFPGYGKMQRERILQALARAEMGESRVFDRLAYLPIRFFPARSQLVLVSPLCRDDFPALVRLRALGYALLVVSPDPVAFEVAHLGKEREVALAARVVRLERHLLLGRLRRAGVVVVDWQVDRSLDRVLKTYLKQIPPLLWGVRVGR